MRQPLVLQNLLELTPAKHPAHGELQAALEKVRVIVVAVDKKKQDYEQRAKLIDIAGRLRGSESDALVQPHRYLLREGELLEIARQSAPFAAKYTSTESAGAEAHAEDAPNGQGAATTRASSGAPRYGLLCNDSFWYCEVLRGNRYSLLHVFHFRSSRERKERTPHSAQASAHIAAGPGDSIWVMDTQLRVQIQPVSGVHGACASEWLASAMEADGISVRDRLSSGRLGTSSHRVAGEV